MNQLALFALFAGAVVAQIPGLPGCSQSCITDFGGCSQVDVKCICSNTALLTKLSCCVSQQCSQSDINEVISFADSLCGGYGVTGLPTAAGCTGSASSTAAASSATMTMTGSMTMTSGAASVSSAISSAASAASSRASEATASASSAASAATASATSAAAAPTNYVQQVLGLGLGAAGILAAL